MNTEPTGISVNSKIGDKGEPSANKSELVMRQLADQLKTVFIVGLLSLWLATLKSGEKVPARRETW